MLLLLAMTTIDPEDFICPGLAVFVVVGLLIRGQFHRLTMINKSLTKILDQLKHNSAGDSPTARDRRMLVYCLKCEHRNDPGREWCTACGHLLSTAQPVNQTKDGT